MSGIAMLRRPETVLFAFACAVVCAALLNLGLQKAAVPNTMRYVPPQSIAYLVTAPIEIYRTGLGPHLQDYLRGRYAASGAAASTVAQLSDPSASGAARGRPSPLHERGVDPDGQASLAVVEDGREVHFITAIPLSDRARFLKSLERDSGKPVVELRAGAASAPSGLLQSGRTIIGFGDDGAALMSSSADAVRSVQATQAANLAYFQSSDWHRRVLTAKLPGRYARAPAWLRGNLRVPAFAALVVGPGTAAETLSDLQFTIAADERSLDIEARALLPDGQAGAQLLAPAPPRADKAARVLERSEAAFSAGDRSLAYLLRYLSAGGASGPLADFERLFPGLLDELRATEGLAEISLAASDPLLRVPGVVFGMALPTGRADKLVFELQASLRAKRDREILRLAADAYRAQASLVESSPVTTQALQQAGMLGDARDPLWKRYVAANERAVPKPALAPRDFENASYVKRGPGDTVLRYVMPPVTDDDVRYRFARQRSEIDAEDLKRDKYRLASAYADGTLWLGNDAEVLGTWLERLKQPPISSDYAEAAARHGGLVDAKLNLLLLPRQLLEASQLYPDDEVNRKARDLLSDVRQYRTALIAFTPHAREREIHVLVSLERR
jgi:hypothetical protein